jgi:hypothetical protein
MAQVGSFKGVKVHSARQSSINGNRVAKVSAMHITERLHANHQLDKWQFSVIIVVK